MKWRRRKQRTFGNTTLAKEEVRYPWGTTWLERLWQDTAYALRTFGRVPGLTAIVIVTLALGIGATSAMFSIVNAVWLHPLPYPNADRLVVVWKKPARDPNSPPIFDSYLDFRVWKDHSRSFEQLVPATWASGGKILSGSGRARELLAMPVGIDFFRMLGTRPAFGRLFEPDDLKRGCSVVLKYQFWVKAFSGQTSIPGRHITLSGQSCTVLGVTPPRFTFFPEAISMWMLITPEGDIARRAQDANVGVFGLLKNGVSRQQAQNELEALYLNQHRGDAQALSVSPVVYPLAEEFAYLTGPTLRLSVIILFAAVSFLLLIVCVNVANLLLGRSLARQKEMAVRAALGSGRLRLIRQLLTEGLLLSFGGALGGVLLGAAAVHLFRVKSPIQMPPGNPVRLDAYVLSFAVALAVLTALLFGLAPALKASRVDLADVLKGAGRNSSLSPAARRFGNILAIVEVALSLALLMGAGLLIESMNRLASTPLGFKTAHVFTWSVELPDWNYVQTDRRTEFYRAILGRASALPGVESAAIASSLPLDSSRWRQSALTLEGKSEPDSSTTSQEIAEAAVTPYYFRLMGVRLAGGRFFDSRDRAHGEPVAIVNEALVREKFRNASPIGKHIKVGDRGPASPWLTIVGVVTDEKDRDFFHEMAWEDLPSVFRPIDQDPPLRASLVLRSIANGTAVDAAVVRQVASIDDNVPVGEMESLDAKLSKLLAYPRFRAVLLGTFAAVALILAGVGLFGVLSQLAAQRTQEFAVRMALGAQKRDVLVLVIRQGFMLFVSGLAGGLIVTFSLTRLLSSLLYGVQSSDPWTVALVSLILFSVSLLATLIPARRGAKVDPVVALRYQ